MRKYGREKFKKNSLTTESREKNNKGFYMVLGKGHLTANTTRHSNNVSPLMILPSSVKLAATGSHGLIVWHKVKPGPLFLKTKILYFC